MNDVFPGDLPRLWQSQETQHAIPSERETRTRAERLQAKVRRNLIFAVVTGFVLLVSCAVSALNLHYPIPRLIAAAMIIPICAIIYATGRRIWPRGTSNDETATACLEFYRKHLHDHHRAVTLKWRLLVPTVLFLWFAITFIGWSFLTLRVLFPSLLGLIFFLRHWEIQKVKRDLATLDNFENEEGVNP